MILLINKNNIFNEELIENFEMIEYENYKEEIIYIEKETFRHFEMLKAHLKVDNIEIEIIDGYRSLEKQETIMLNEIKKYGIDKAEELIDMPGTSEHHTGQAIDYTIKINNKYLSKEEMLKEEKIIQKINKSLKYFGFILRYPKNKENITFHKYKPWHIRYIGEEDALKINDQPLETYLYKKNLNH